MKRTFLITAAVVLTACKTFPPVPVEPPGTDKCAAACERLRELGCPEGDPLPDGSTCESFCVETQKAGHFLDPGCAATISTCGELSTKCGM